MSPVSPYTANLALQAAQFRQEMALPMPAETIQPGNQTAGVDPFSQMGGPSQVASANNFENLLGTFVREVNGKQMEASQVVGGLLRGENVPLHQAMLSMEEASVSFQLMVEVRNKLLEGYQELLRMQV